ncbi:MAG: hypothetical protein EOO77_23940 [Oxalobacteraceae bacterium]|nr:MAG: hypothetical protein EOO77_23940 [Oxalobacteraceae bacterium]
MPLVETDIDIDFANRDDALRGLHHIPAAVRDKQGRFGRHNSGVYFQPVPVNPLTGLCAYTYDEAAEFGYFKIDFLNNSIYQGVRDEAHLDALLAQDPEWELFDDPVFVAELPHLGKHFGTVQSVRPRSIDDLAVILALIRPGKKHLIGKPRSDIQAEVWNPDAQGYHFKRAHAVAYAVSIVVKLNLLIETMSASLDQADAPF